jgi:HEPN domain-containing protein
MIDIPKQIEYWATSSDEDFAAAQSLLEKGHFRHCLFFAHLAIEKMLKAHVTRQTKDVPPHIHNLIRLSEMAGLSLDPEQADFLRRFDMYQLEGCYPELSHTIIDLKAAKERLALAGDILKWLNVQL